MPVSLDRSTNTLYAATDASTLVVSFERFAPPDALSLSAFKLISLPFPSPFQPPSEQPIERPAPVPVGPADPGSSDNNPTPQLQRPERPDAALRPERGERTERPELVLRPERPESFQRPDRADLPRAELAAPSVDQVVDKLMQRFDADDNGRVTLTEFGAGFTIGGRRLELGPLLTRLFDHLDRDDSSTLTAAEFRSVLARLDRDGDGRLEWGEAPPIVTADAVGLVGVLSGIIGWNGPLQLDSPGSGG